MARTSLERDVARILEGIDPVASSAPVLLLLVGLPGTGKTFLAQELKHRTRAVVLESDAIRTLLFRERRYSRTESRRLFAAIHAAVDALLANRTSVIVDATNLAERERTPLYTMAERRGVRLVLAYLTTPRDIARARLEQRRASGLSHSEADLAVYERMQSRIEEIRLPHHVIDTSRDIEPALGALAKEMMRS